MLPEPWVGLLTAASPCPGWSGCGGLGAKEQGIQDPIRGGDIRDKWDQFKGVGVSLDDPYENYRKNKSYNFVARMKAREEGRRSLLLQHATPAQKAGPSVTVLLCVSVSREPQEAPPTD